MNADDLKKYCSKDETRPYLHEPFSRGEWTYATNGHIAVRVPKLADVPEPQKVVDASRVFTNTDGITFSALSLSLKPKTADRCWICNGSGSGFHDCPSCDCDCPSCEGTGTITGEEQCSVTIRGVPFAKNYARMLSELPGLAVPQTPKLTEGMPFRFDGGEGVLMPLRVAREKNEDAR